MTSRIDDTVARIEQSGVIAILRGDFGLDRILRVAEVLTESGVSILEITLNSRSALEAIGRLVREFPGEELVVGAGTVRTIDQFAAAADAGVVFTVAPNLDPKVVARAADRDVAHLPGVLTPSEAEEAFRAGSRLVKLFPADVLGPAYLKALRAPLDDIGFVPTGGIGPENLPDYVRAGARAVGVGSSLIGGPDQDLARLGARASALRRAWEQSHGR